MKIKFFLLLIFLSPLSLPDYIDDRIESFFNSLIAGSADLSEYVLKSELQKSQRLGIEYEGVKNKFLISFDIDEQLKKEIREKKIRYELKEENINGSFAKITFLVKERNYSKDFYFKDYKLVSPAFYFTSSWKNFKTRNFYFFISDTSLFNNYSIETLENYISAITDLLQLSAEQKKNLEEKKIIYILCKDEDEIKKLTGFETRGIYILAYDEIITTYNCHFHELAHLLINFKLRTLPLYTLPFFQEGFAVAAGGRGGLARNVLFDAGCFLQKSGIIKFNSIISKEEFLSENASITYPVAGLYTLFLMREYGIDSYLNVYKKYSGSEEFVSEIETSSLMLPSIEKFEKFVDSIRTRTSVSVDVHDTNGKVISESSSYSITETEDHFMISLRRNILLTPPDHPRGYRSRKFAEVFPNTEYKGEKYLITAASREINIYNLYTNILIASYSAGFSLDNKEVPLEKGFFKFVIKRDIFDEDPDPMTISAL